MPTPSAPSPDAAAFAAALADETLRVLRALAVFVALAFVVILGMDLANQPEQAVFFATLRLSYVAIAAGLALLLHSPERRVRLRPWASALAQGFVWLTFLTMSAVLPVAVGLKDGLVLGSYIALIFSTTLLPLPLRQQLPTQVAVALASVLAMWVLPGDGREFPADELVVTLLAAAMGGTFVWQNLQLRREAFHSHRQIEALLRNILPEEIADELRQHGEVEAREVDDCTILFSDFVGFTALSARVPPARLVQSLDTAFQRFDRISAGHGLEKLKTIGDAYMCAGGVLEAQPDHLERCLRAGLEMLAALDDPALVDPEGQPWRMRLGLHSGPVVAGIIGSHKFAFDLWGDTVNVAARAESAGRPGGVCMTAALYRGLPAGYRAEALGVVELKGKGPVEMVLVTGRA